MGAIASFNTKNGRPIKLHYGVKGMMERVNPSNFSADGSNKYKLGLHDLSATLLTSGRDISDQLKHYSDATWVFMPLRSSATGLDKSARAS